jgi:hypothetical protein
LRVEETGHGPVYYIPEKDVRLDLMHPTEHHTRCPYKGEASYYTLRMDTSVEENVAWSYEDPIDTVSEITGRIAFYPDRVRVYSVDDAVVNPHHHRELERRQIDEVVQHTDSGDGVSQGPRWSPDEAPFNKGEAP